MQEPKRVLHHNTLFELVIQLQRLTQLTDFQALVQHPGRAFLQSLSVRRAARKVCCQQPLVQQQRSQLVWTLVDFVSGDHRPASHPQVYIAETCKDTASSGREKEQVGKSLAEAIPDTFSAPANSFTTIHSQVSYRDRQQKCCCHWLKPAKCLKHCSGLLEELGTASKCLMHEPWQSLSLPNISPEVKQHPVGLLITHAAKPEEADLRAHQVLCHWRRP